MNITVTKTMNKRSSCDIAFVSMIRILVFIVIGVLDQHRVLANRFCNNNPSPPSCADDCSGNGFYLSQDGTSCLQCPTCEPGKELNKICGDGLNGDAECEPCQEGFYSAHRARRCMPCRSCTNTVELKACERTSDRECGDCLSGYLRSQDRFGDPDACPHRCQDHSADTPGCEDWWREQIGGDSGGIVADGDIPPKDELQPQEYDDELCESTPPQCEDDCHGNRLYLGRDGLCKLCLQCQPGYELDKDCGNGINGDAKCRSCKEGTFSADGRGPCIPCRICVNTEELIGCEPTSDRQCGDCLPGYFQAAKGFFPDPNACPNSCAENPRATPECIEWWQRQDLTAVERPQNSAEPEKVHLPLPTKEKAVFFQTDENQGNDKQIAKKSSTSLHHTSYMTVITALASLLIVVVVLVIFALVVLKIYTKRLKPRDIVINDAGGPLINRSGNSTPETATPDMANSRSSSRIYKESPVLPSAPSLSNKPQYLEKINQSHVQGVLPYRIDQMAMNREDLNRYHPSIHDGPDSKQSLHDSDRKTLRFQMPPPLWKSKAPSDVGPSAERKDAVFYNSDGNGTTRSVQDNNTEGTRLRRRSSINPPTPEGIQVLRRNSAQLYHLANNGRREELTGDCEGRTDSLDTAQKEPEAGLFPVDSPHEADGRETVIVDKLNQHQDIAQGRNSQYNSFQDGQRMPRRKDADLDTGAWNTGKTMTTSPNQIEQGRLERASTIDNRKKAPVGQKHRGQHPSSTSFTITSESPVINISVTSPKVKNMQVGDVYNEHHDGTQDALLGSVDDISDEKQDGSNEEEDQLLYHT